MSEDALLSGLSSLRGRAVLESRPVITPKAPAVRDEFEDLPPIDFDSAVEATESGRPGWWFEGAEHLDHVQTYRINAEYLKVLKARKVLAKLAVETTGGSLATVSDEQVLLNRQARLKDLDLKRAVKAMWTFEDSDFTYVGVFYPGEAKGIFALMCDRMMPSKANPELKAARPIYLGEQVGEVFTEWPETQPILQAVLSATEEQWQMLASNPAWKRPPVRKDKPPKPEKVKATGKVKEALV